MLKTPSNGISVGSVAAQRAAAVNANTQSLLKRAKGTIPRRCAGKKHKSGGRGSSSVFCVFLKRAKGTIPRRRVGQEHKSGGRGSSSVLRVFLSRAKGTIPRRRVGQEHKSGGRGSSSVLGVFLRSAKGHDPAPPCRTGTQVWRSRVELRFARVSQKRKRARSRAAV